MNESHHFLRNKSRHPLNFQTLSSWIKFGKLNKRPSYTNTKFAKSENVRRLFLAHMVNENVMDNRQKKKIDANPLEMVKHAFLLDRSAIKFANIDSQMDYMFSNPVDKRNQSLIQPNEIMYFVDVNGGRGGFSDYILWRRNWQTKGFGIPLKGIDYLHSKFTVGGQQFIIFNCDKKDKGVVTTELIESIVHYVKQHVPLGVHVATADCGITVSQKGYWKETILKQTHLIEMVVALSLLRPNGHFIIKLYDVLLPFTVGLIYLMHKCFAEIYLMKPKSSRPASPER